MKHLNVAAIALAMLNLPHAAQAANSCTTWKTAITSLMGEGEGLNTSYCSKEKGLEADFEIVCAGKDVNFRFSPTGGIEGKDFGNAKVNVDYTVDGKTFTLPSMFEALDGAFAASTPLKGPLLMAMKSGKAMTVSAKKNQLPVYHV
ncbi:MAG: hypothetical protein KGO94_07150, partial [Alphaproteobacteria bacterium]|nr:hypothetical protein [Alphaproteobacteria bacterium]